MGITWGKKVNILLRRIVTRFVNVIPITIAIFLGFDPLHIQVYSQVILSLLIPLPIIPLVILTRNKKLMDEFVNRKITTIVASIFVGIIVAFNSHMLLSLWKGISFTNLHSIPIHVWNRENKGGSHTDNSCLCHIFCVILYSILDEYKFNYDLTCFCGVYHVLSII